MERVLGGTDKVILDERAGSGVVPYLPLSEFTKKAPAPAEEGQQ
jgi:membrane protease subunit HflK